MLIICQRIPTNQKTHPKPAIANRKVQAHPITMFKQKANLNFPGVLTSVQSEFAPDCKVNNESGDRIEAKTGSSGNKGVGKAIDWPNIILVTILRYQLTTLNQ